MKKILLLLSFIVITLNAQISQSGTCKGCHPLIVSEFENSMHKNTSIYQDELHSKIWDIHPDKKNKQYSCAKCHTPTDLELISKLDKNEPAMPSNNAQAKEGISCVYCHSIKAVEHGKTHNKNILTNKEKVFYSADSNKREKAEVAFKEKSSLFGMFKSKEGSPYHKIDYTNKNYYDANVCMGCHSHLQNNNDVDLCRTDLNKIKDEKTNCISCHMQKVKGSLSTIKVTKTHTSHSFAGAHNDSDLLSKYIKFHFVKTSKGFNIAIKNEAAHDLFLQPLRVAKLFVTISSNEKLNKLKPVIFKKVFAGKDNKPTAPWNATKILQNSMLKANEKKILEYTTKVSKGDYVEITLAYHLVSPKMAKKLALKNSDLSKLKILKSKTFKVDY